MTRATGKPTQPRQSMPKFISIKNLFMNLYPDDQIPAHKIQRTAKDMRVIFPYTADHLQIGALKALLKYWPSAESVDVSGSDTSYWELLDYLWDEGETFSIVEHDIEVKQNSLSELAQCPELWCVVPYGYYLGQFSGLGCCKFDKKLLKEFPDALTMIAAWSEEYTGDPGHTPKHWCRLDGWLRIFLEDRGQSLHIHGGILRHLGKDKNGSPTHGCVTL
jgi:hypothetical protein